MALPATTTVFPVFGALEAESQPWRILRLKRLYARLTVSGQSSAAIGDRNSITELHDDGSYLHVFWVHGPQWQEIVWLQECWYELCGSEPVPVRHRIGREIRRAVTAR